MSQKIFPVLALLFFLFRDVEMERTVIGLQHKIYIHHNLADQSFFQHQNTEPIPSSVMVGSFANSGELIIVPNALDNHVLAVNVCSKFSHYCKESCQPTGRTGRSLYSSDFIFEQLITSLSRQLLLLCNSSIISSSKQAPVGLAEVGPGSTQRKSVQNIPYSLVIK